LTLFHSQGVADPAKLAEIEIFEKTREDSEEAIAAGQNQ